MADSQVKVAELYIKFEQFRSSSFNLNHLLNSQRNSKDFTSLGYSEVSPLINENYNFLKDAELNTKPNVNVPVESTVDRSVESSIANLKLDEQAKSNEELYKTF